MKAILDHVVENVINEETDGVIVQLIKDNRINSLHDIFALSKEDIFSLQYKENNVMVTPRKHESARLNILKAWNAALIAQIGELTIDYQDVSLVNETTYNEFRVSGYNPHALFTPPT